MSALPKHQDSTAVENRVIGIDSTSRSWVTVRRPGSSIEPLPPLDGALLVSEAALQEATGDFGLVVNRVPSAVLRPGSVDDIIKMVQFARKRGMKIAPRGQGHTLYGQSQVEGGISIDMRALATIHSLQADRADVDAGVLWSVLVAQAFSQGATPPVLTDFLDLTIGGTLSMGGVSGTSFRYGTQVDNVLELQVVTGAGEMLTCSPSQHRDLFEAVLAGLGQCGIIVRATVRLIPAPTHVRFYDLGYTDPGARLQDQLRIVQENRFDYLLGFTFPAENGGWTHRLHALAWYTPPELPEDAPRLAGLSYDKGTEQTIDMPYLFWVNRLKPQVETLQRLGHLTRQHVWSDIFLPASRLDSFFKESLAEVSPAEISPFFPVLTYLFQRKHLTRPLFRVPETEEICLLYSILRTVSPDTQEASQMVAANRALYDRSQQWGGTHYPHAALPLSPEDWKARYGSAWEAFEAAKRRYDPDTLLTPGPGIFRSP